MLALITFLETIHADDRSDEELSGAEQDQLEGMINGQHDRAANWAQNLLCFYYDRCRAPLTGGDDGPKSLRPTPLVEESLKAVMSIYPNPSTTWAAVDVKLVSAPDNANLRIIDATGRLIQQHTLNVKEQQVIVDTRGLAVVLPKFWTVS